MSSRPSRGAARLAAILDALPDALILVNCNGTVVNANSIALEVFESPGTALVGRGLLDLLPEFDSNRIPGSMRRPEEIDEAAGRTKPQRMTARRTDGSAFAVEVTSANLEDSHTPYASAVEAAFADYGTSGSGGYTGDELLMLVVRDLTGTLDTEVELSRQQRQTEMILRSASEGVMGVDAQGRIVLVNPAAAQILGHRAGDLGGQELHPLVHHSRSDGTPLPFEETPLADTLRSGRKHRVRVGQVLWAKDGRSVPVDMTSAPVRDGEQLVGAVLTFTDRRPYDELAARHAQLEAVVGEGLRVPLERMRTELSGLADDPAGQLWPEANQILRHLAAGYGRMTTLVDNVLRYQRLDSGAERLKVRTVRLDEVVQSAIEGADELIGPGRAQFAVHTPPIDAELDAEQLATALAHLVADVAGVDSTGNAAPLPSGVDPTIVVAVAQRGEAVRIEVRGPYSGGDRVHQPLVRGIVGKHGGVLQTHEVPGAGGSAFVVELPTVGAAEASRPAAGARVGKEKENETTVMPAPARPVRGSAEGESAPGAGAWSGAASGGPAEVAAGGASEPGAAQVDVPGGAYVGPGEAHAGTDAVELPGGTGAEVAPRPTGRRRGRPSPAEEQHEQADPADTAARAGEDRTPPQGTGRRARRALAEPHGPGAESQSPAPGALPALGPGESGQVPDVDAADAGSTGGGRRARRLAAARARAEAAQTEQGPQHAPFALPPAPSEQAQSEAPAPQDGASPPARTGDRPDPHVGEGPAPSHAAPDPAAPALPAPGMPSEPGPSEPGPSEPGPSAPTGFPVSGESSLVQQTESPRGLVPPRPHAPDDAHPAPGAQPGQPAPAHGSPEETGRQPHAPSAGEPAQHPLSAGQQLPSGEQQFPAAPSSGPLAQQPLPTAPSATPDGPAPVAPESQVPGVRPAPGAAEGQSVPGPSGVPEGQVPGVQSASGAYASGAGPQPPSVPGVPEPQAPGAQPAPDAQAPGARPPHEPHFPMAPGAHGPQAPGAQPAPDAPGTTDPQPPHQQPALAPTPPPGTHDPQTPAPPPATAAPTDHRDPPPPFAEPPVPGWPAPTALEPAQSSVPPQYPETRSPDVQSGHQQAPRTPPQPPAGAPAPAEAPEPSALPNEGSAETAAQEAAATDEFAPPPPAGPEDPGVPGEAEAGSEEDRRAGPSVVARSPILGGGPLPEQQQANARGLPMPEGLAEPYADGPQVRTLGQGVPFSRRPGDGADGRQAGQTGASAIPSTPSTPTPLPGSGRRRKLATPPDEAEEPAPADPQEPPQQAQPPQQPVDRRRQATGAAREFTIGAPSSEAAEGPEPLDGPDSPVEVTEGRGLSLPAHADDELPPEPLDNPRRLLVWPEPDTSTQLALSERGYRPVLVHSREEVDAQIAAYPAALFVDPLTGPITRTALQSLRTAAVAAEVPVLVTAGLGQATREAAYGADPAVLLKALAPRDSEQHPPRVLLVEEDHAIAGAFVATLERRGMQAVHAETDAAAVEIAAQVRPNLVVMDLMQVRRRRAGIIDWLRVNGLLNRTPFVVYTSADLDPAELPRLASGETVLFLAERSTQPQVQSRIVDLLTKIGAN